MRTLVIDTATAACSVALIEAGAVIAAIHEVVQRGHAERLIPMIAELPDGGRAEAVLVDCGPGSFTGIRVGLAAARALGLAWGVPVMGYSATAILAAAGLAERPGEAIAVAIEGGHGEVFMQTFAAPFEMVDPLASLTPADALVRAGGRRIVGSGVRWLTPLDAAIDATETLPRAADAVLLPTSATALPPVPIYGRAPDAKPPQPPRPIAAP